MILNSLRETIEKTTDTMLLFLTSSGRINFTQMARCSSSCEIRFRKIVKKPFGILSSNCYSLAPIVGHRDPISIDLCFISKADKRDFPQRTTGKLF